MGTLMFSVLFRQGKILEVRCASSLDIKLENSAVASSSLVSYHFFRFSSCVGLICLFKAYTANMKVINAKYISLSYLEYLYSSSPLYM